MNYYSNIRTEGQRTQPGPVADARVPGSNQPLRSQVSSAVRAGTLQKGDVGTTPFADFLAQAQTSSASTSRAPRLTTASTVMTRPGSGSTIVTPQAALTGSSQTDSVQFSAHASQRLRMRGIVPTTEMVRSLDTAMTQLSAKQARDSLVVIGDLGFVVNVPNRTVVTAISMSQAGSHLYTNIDSAMWMAPPVSGA